MNIELREGVCKFCGQMGFVKAPELEQDEIDKLVTDMCTCPDAKNLQEERDRRQRILDATDRAQKSIDKIFEDKPGILHLFNSNAEKVASGVFKSITVKLDDEDITATMKLKNDGYIRIERKETEKKVAE